MHMGIMLQPDSIIRCKQAQHNNCRLAHTADYYPLFAFAMHMGIMLQPEGTIRCKQAQHNNCRLAHTADYYPFLFFCNAHGNHVVTRGHPTLQTSATICSSGNLLEGILLFFCNRTRDLCLQPEPTKTFATTKTFTNIPHKTLTMKPQIISDLWVLQPEVCKPTTN
jgi:predicted N-acetyltransferase YhbS